MQPDTHDAPMDGPGLSLLNAMGHAMVAAYRGGSHDLGEAWSRAYHEHCQADRGSPAEQLRAIELAAAVSVADVDRIARTVVAAVGLPPTEADLVRQHLAVAPAHLARMLAATARHTAPGNTLLTVLPLDALVSGEVQRNAFVRRLLPGAPRYAAGQAVSGRPGWTFTSFLGAGSQGEVWCVADADGARQAMKLCHDDAAAGQLRREARNLAILQRDLGDHPNIVPVYAVDVEANPPWIAMELVSGGTLEDLIQARGPSGIAEAYPLWRRICDGVAAAHALGLVHRDLKPANILIDERGAPKVADFGIGALSGQSPVGHATQALTSPGLGTVLYASPEQRGGAPPSPRDDVYALGVILFQMLLGSTRAVPPHRLARAFESHPRPPSRGTLALIDRCLDTRDHRPANAHELHRKLALRPEPHGVAGAQRPVARCRRGLWMALVAVVVVAAILALVLPGPLKRWERLASRPRVNSARVDRAPAYNDLTTAGHQLRASTAGGFEVPGFTFLGWHDFACPNDVEGLRSFRIAVYRCDRIYEAIQAMLAPGDEAIDAQFVVLPPDGRSAQYTMGSPADEADRDADETRLEVAVHPFLIARTELTQRVFDALHGVAAQASQFSGPLRPRERINWSESVAFCDLRGLRLPTEVEWEYACRGGTRTAYCFGNALLRDQGSFRDPRYDTLPVASPGASVNAYGLFDMHGSVWEWCDDELDGWYPPRIARGGCCWGYAAWRSRSADRNHNELSHASASVGLRLAAVAR